MLVSFNWLKEYVNLNNIEVGDLADQITLTGLEVEDILGSTTGIENLRVGDVKVCEPVEGSDRLNLTQVDVGEEDLQQIVCGAPNVAKGQKVIVAMPGAVLPGDFKIKKAKLMGIESNGMICALDELGFSDSVIPKYAEEGIYILPDSAKAGDDANTYIGLDNPVIELDLTPNRADALSMRGIAHEVGAILEQNPTFYLPKVQENSEQIEDLMKVTTENEEDTYTFKVRLIKDVTIGESPLWMQRKLMAAGIRPIDSVVDITNYVMLEYGQPLHAYDYDKIGTSQIHVRRGKDGETVTTIDSKERKVSSDNLLITDGENPIGLAGVMGGQGTQVTDDTKTIALEAAVFHPTLIRRTANQMNLRSEASNRYEKGVNLSTVQEALDYASELIAEIAGGDVVGGVVSVDNKEPSNTEVQVEQDYINQVIGLTLSADEIASTLDRLGFEYDINEGVFDIVVPPRRWDISIPADIVEEVARVHGYNKIPSTLPTTESVPGELSDIQRYSRHLRSYLENKGLNQAISYALTTNEKATLFSTLDGETISLKYPMSEEHQTLRQSLLTSLLDDVEYNNARQMNDISLYELGRVFEKGDNQYIETEHIAGMITGSLTKETWSEKSQAVDFFQIKGIVEELLESLAFSQPVTYALQTDMKEFHPGRTADIFIGDTKVGLVGQIHPTLATDRDLSETYAFELDLTALVELEKETQTYDLIPKYPGTSRDIALLVDDSVNHDQVISIIEANSNEWLQDIHLFDIYQGEHIEEGKKSVAYSLFYQNPQANLKDDEVDAEFQKVTDALKQELKAEVR